MKTKICTKCKKSKSIRNFSKKEHGKFGVNSICKECACNYTLNYYQKIRKESPWKEHFRALKERCINLKSKNYKYYGGRGIKCLITEKEIKELWFRDKAYELKRPSIDRIDNDGNYIFNNCQFLEMKINSGKNKEVPILQFDLHGNLIKEWSSATKAGKAIGINRSCISACIRKITKFSAGFIWRYK